MPRRVIWLFLLLGLPACTTLRPIAPATVAAREAPGSGIYVIRRGWHVDVAFSVSQLPLPLAALKAEFVGARYLVLGFGDWRYLLKEGPQSTRTLFALWPARGLILVTGLTAPPAAAFGQGHVRAIAVDAEQLERASKRAWGSLLQVDRAVVPFAPGPYPGSAFYSANTDYSAIHTCNTWAAEVLAGTGLPIHSGGVIFAWQLWDQLQGGLVPLAQTAVEP